MHGKRRPVTKDDNLLLYTFKIKFIVKKCKKQKAANQTYVKCVASAIYEIYTLFVWIQMLC